MRRPVICGLVVAACVSSPPTLWPSAAKAQDPNLQSRVETLAPAASDTTLQPRERTVRVPQFRRVTKPVDVPYVEMVRTLRQKNVPNVDILAVDRNKVAEEYRKLMGTTQKMTSRLTFAGFKDKKVVEPRKIVVELTDVTTYYFGNNVFNRKTNVIGDYVFSTAPAANIKIPVGATDTFAVYLSSTFARYAEQRTLDQDILLGSLTYTALLRSIAASPGSQTSPKELMKYSLVARGSYAPGFDQPATWFYSPAIEWSLGGLPLTQRLCGPGPKKVNCVVAGIAAELGRTYVDPAPNLDNTRFKLSGSVTWYLHGTELSFSVGGGVTDFLYDSYPGKRNDVVFLASSGLTWNQSETFTLTAGARYTRQTSSLDQLEYDGYVLQPTITGQLKF